MKQFFTAPHRVLLNRPALTVGTLTISGLLMAGSLSLSVLPTIGAPVSPTGMRFPTATGRISYRMSTSGGFASNGTLSMTWADQGRRFSQETRTTSNFRGQSSAFTTRVICDGKALYLIMPGPGKQATKMPLAEATRMVSGPMKSFSGVERGKVIGHATILGKPCEIRSVSIKKPNLNMQMKAWLWQGLPLRAVSTVQYGVPSGGKGKGAVRKGVPITVSLRATGLDTSIRPTAASFRLPPGYTVKSLNRPR